MEEIEDYMKSQFDPTLYIVRERYKFWADLKRKPGESVHELAARIRQDAVTCDFAKITDPLDEALRTRFICSVNNEAVLKALFRIKDKDLTFAKAIEVANETEDAARVAKETVHGTKFTSSDVHKVSKKKSPCVSKSPADRNNKQYPFPKGTCTRCGSTSHTGQDCSHINTTCNYCKIKGHLETVCLKKKRGITPKPIKVIYGRIQASREVKAVNKVTHVPQIEQLVEINNHSFHFEVDTGAGDNFCTTHVWEEIGKPNLSPASSSYESATGDPIPTLGTFTTDVSLPNKTSEPISIQFTVVKQLDLNLLGRDAIKRLGIDITAMLNATMPDANKVNAVFDNLKPDVKLQNACSKLCSEFPDLFKPELGCLKDFQLDVKFKDDSKLIFCKPRPVPFAIQDDLNQAYDAGIKRGVWEPTQFNAYGTPVVPIRKALLSGQAKAKIRVCGDYSVTVNPYLDEHRHPVPLPDDLMRKLGGGHGFTKIDLADAYNQIMLTPESQQKLALSTHRGVLLQRRLPFGIKSAPGYFQSIMEQLTSDLKGVAVYLDDILISGDNAEDHLNNLRALLTRLQEKGLRCRLEKCVFAQPVVEYLGHLLSNKGIAKGPKVDAVKQMPRPQDVSTLKSFLGSVQFYGKFLPNLSTITEPLFKLTKRDTPWRWGADEEAAFTTLKMMLCKDTVLAHFDPKQEIGISCDASDVGVGVVLFHRYPDGSERPIANASKTLSDTQRRYSQIQKEALSIIFALHKFHQFLYGRKFILVTDHKPLTSLFGPSKATPMLAANRLARWALLLNQYDYKIEYRNTKEHGNADALSRLPMGPDTIFDGEESDNDIDTICIVKTISMQISNSVNSALLAKETQKDPVLSTVMRYTREGWPPKLPDEKSVQAYSVDDFRKIQTSLSTVHGCLLHGNRVVVPAKLHSQVLQLLHIGHCGMQRMKQLARTAVYWPRIDDDIMKQSRNCSVCAEHQNMPTKVTNHPWMLPEKPWSRIHIDHAINFLGSNWLLVTDAYSKYPCIHPTTSTSTKSTIDLLEEDFAHFGYPHTIVSDNATSFMSSEFQAWCKERGIVHLTGAPYHPATNGSAERLVQTFKQALKKSSLPPKKALTEFLMQYRRTPLASGFSPSELLNGRQIRTKIDTLLPSPAHIAQEKQTKENVKSHTIAKLKHAYNVGTPCYALYCGPRRDKDPRWVPATVIKVFGSRSVSVRVHPRGPTWRRHIDQLRPRYGIEHDDEPAPVMETDQPVTPAISDVGEVPKPQRTNPRLPIGSEYGPENPRRSQRTSKQPMRLQYK